MSLQAEIKEILGQLGIQENNQGASTGANWLTSTGAKIASVSPVDAQVIAHVTMATPDQYNQVIEKAQAAFVE